MTTCDKHRADIVRYLNNELSEKRLTRFLAHLNTCADCRTELEEEEALSDVLRQSRPLYSAPAELRERISILYQQTKTDSPPDPVHRSPKHFAERFFLGFPQPARRLAVLATVALAITVGLLIAPRTIREVRAASYVTTAVATHRSYLTGHLPLEIRSSSPELVSMWLSDKLSFPFRLPDSRSKEGSNPSYRLVGARLVDCKGRQAALLAYEEAHKDAISLLVADSRLAVVAGGDEVRSGDLVFHYRNESGFRVITWSTHGLSYALVSSVTGPPGASCLVCHQDMADHDHFGR